MMYTCDACNQECDVVCIDEGGYEEVWGARMWHAQWVDVSDCCHDNFEEVDDDGTDL